MRGKLVEFTVLFLNDSASVCMHARYAIHVHVQIVFKMYLPIVPHPSAICSVLEIGGMTPFARR